MPKGFDFESFPLEPRPTSRRGNMRGNEITFRDGDASGSSLLSQSESVPSRRTGIQEFEAEALPHLEDLYRTAASILRNRTEAEDAVQEAYLQALKSFYRFTPGTNCRAWLFRILFHVISHHRRKWLGRLVFSEREEMEQTTVYTPPVSEELTDDEMLAAFRKLPRQFAEVVMLSDVQEFSYKEIQETLGIPIGTVMSRLSRGRQLLRAQLAECGARAGIVREGTRSKS
jgi:RNA polymerase sigma-70 factor (ECF subfamily)